MLEIEGPFLIGEGEEREESVMALRSRIELAKAGGRGPGRRDYLFIHIFS